MASDNQDMDAGLDRAFMKLVKENSLIREMLIYFKVRKTASFAQIQDVFEEDEKQVAANLDQLKEMHILTDSAGSPLSCKTYELTGKGHQLATKMLLVK